MTGRSLQTMTSRKPELPPELAEWVATSGGTIFCAALRKRIENGGKLDRPLPLQLTDRQCSDLIELFGTRAVGPKGVHLREANNAIVASRFGLALRGLLIAESGPLITRRGRARYERMVKSAAVRQERSDLLASIEGVDELVDEYALLKAVTQSHSWQVPAGSRTDANSWPTYRSALRASAEWFQGRARGWKFGERELAVLALGGSKRWTEPAKRSFCLLIGEPFTEAVHTTDTAVYVIGPIRWIREHLIADATDAAPFIGLPGRASATEGHLYVPAAGVLLIENQETFESVARTSVPETWLCIWAGGYGSDALVALLKALPPIPIAAWGDLDPPGIEIIQNLIDRARREIRPVGMDASDYTHGPYLEEPHDARAQWRAQAQQQALTARPYFVPLARAIAANHGHRCEQEGLHERVLPDLKARLDLLRPPVPPSSV